MEAREQESQKIANDIKQQHIQDKIQDATLMRALC
jgi:hypothetical protein